ncbi:MAG: M48 family metallopeptidase [Proteobacteria bacterium]|nr:M48 family metallopeptidase [Pseudomonadota bacterium]MBU1688933.1 M48 family metallopeptidase [Pseudomonadota bacterium]
MDFFASQDQARQSTSRLVILFSLAVLSLIAMTNMLVLAVFGFLGNQESSTRNATLNLDWEVFGAITLGVILIVGLGSLYKIMQLSGGGDRIAQMLDGQLIVDSSGDADKQKILNVVEEMAIASGSPVPPVYLLDDDAINAFAAGYTTSDAVIGITRGAIQKLSRDQLQGVIAHEFSHILNGDMRLNIRLIGTLHGILILGMVGYYILRSGSRSSRSNSKGGGGAILFLGIGLMVIGYSGTFFGNLIKAAVSRQREFLADASAVQYTRNPDGIGGALKRIGNDTTGSTLTHPGSSEISHALFCQGFTSFFGSLFATHPPLAERIKKIQPDWDGKFEGVNTSTRQPPPIPPEKSHKERIDQTTSVLTGILAATAMESVGRPTQQHLGYARELIAGLPKVLKNAVHQPYAARAVIYCLVLDTNDQIRDRQLRHLEKAADSEDYQMAVRLANEVRRLQPASRLPLLDMAMPALRQLSQQQFGLFRENLMVLIEADGKLSLFEWALQKIVIHHLDGAFGGHSGKTPQSTTLTKSTEACALLLTLLVNATKHRGMTTDEVFAAAAAQLPDLELAQPEKQELTLIKLDLAMDELSGLMPQEKQKLLTACATAVLADQQIDPVEAELLRAIADTFNCPMPPLIG